MRDDRTLWLIREPQAFSGRQNAGAYFLAGSVLLVLTDLAWVRQ